MFFAAELKCQYSSEAMQFLLGAHRQGSQANVITDLKVKMCQPKELSVQVIWKSLPTVLLSLYKAG